MTSLESSVFCTRPDMLLPQVQFMSQLICPYHIRFSAKDKLNPNLSYLKNICSFGFYYYDGKASIKLVK